MAVAAPQGLRAIAGRHWVEFGVAFDAGIEPAVPVLTLLTEWPLGIGAVVDGHRLLLPLTVECGNQVVQGSEACDDGNLDVGDGCDACMIELEGGLDDLRFDDVGEDVGDCSCRTDAPGRGIAEPLLGWLVLGGARRRLARS